MEKTIELEVRPLLQGLSSDDECYKRLESAIQSQNKILRAHLKYDHDPVVMCLHYDPDIISLSHIKKLAIHAGAEITSRYHHDLIQIQGMDCSDCAMVIEHSVSRMDGVLAASVSYANQSMRVEYDTQKINRSSIEKRIRSLGYEISRVGIRSWYSINREFIFSLASGVFLLIGWLGSRFLGFSSDISLIFYLTAYAFGGWDITLHVIKTFREWIFDTDFLMLIAAIGAAVSGMFEEGALLLFLFSLGHALEERALDRARSAVRALAEIAPKSALIKRNSQVAEVPVEKISLGDTILVRPGVRIPVDGSVISGQSSVNQASITGESTPILKNPGDQVFAGSVNGDQPLDIKATRLAKDSTLSRVMQMVEEAQTHKSAVQNTIDRFGRIFVPIILITTICIILILPLFGFSLHDSIMRAMAMLVAASPCALVLGTPATILAGIAQGARNGILIKGGIHLENLGRIKGLAFDKTGTITRGYPEVIDIIAFANGINKLNENEILSLAASIESQSAHPLAQAISREAHNRKLALSRMHEVVSVTGRGIKAKKASDLIYVGSLDFIRESGIELNKKVVEMSSSWQMEGKIVIAVAINTTFIGLITLRDQIRPGTSQVMKSLKSAGVNKLVILTGDNEKVASNVAKQVGIEDFVSNLMPEDKLAAVRKLIEETGVVGMVGDGVNDAPALAYANVGIAMGGASTDVALETADVALMANDLSRLPFAILLGKAARKIIIQNLAIAILVIVSLVIASVIGLTNIGVVITFHESSTLIVVINALRLLAFHTK